MAARFEISKQTSNHLTVSAPGAFLLSPLLALAIVAFFTLILYSASRSARRVLVSSKTPAELSSYLMRFRLIGSGIGLASLGLFWLISYNSGSIVLDRAENVATMRTRITAFLPARQRSVLLDTVERAILDYKPNARRIRLVVSRGGDLAYPIWSDRPGQQEAVAAINAFLGHGPAVR